MVSRIGNETAATTKAKDAYLLEESEEFHLLLNGVEENCKHARTVMFALVFECVYAVLVLLNVLVADGVSEASSTPLDAGPKLEFLKLPVLQIQILKANFILFVSPIVLITYMYLHVYIRELRQRLKSVKEFLHSRSTHSPDSDHFLFPWFAVFAFQCADHDEDLSTSESACQRAGTGDTSVVRIRRQRGEGRPVRLLSYFLLWLMGPFMLLGLWSDYVLHKDSVSIVPCLCFIGSIYIGRKSAVHDMPRWIAALLTLFVTALVGITALSALPVTEYIGLESVWTFLESAKSYITEVGSSFWGMVGAFIVALQLLPAVPWLLLRPFGTATLRARLPFAAAYNNFMTQTPAAIADTIALLCFASTVVYEKAVNSLKFAGIPMQVTGRVLKGCNVSGYDLKSVDFSNADLNRTNFRAADLRHCKFLKAKLTNADMANADLRGAQFAAVQSIHEGMGNTRPTSLVTHSEARMAGLNLHDATIDSETVFPTSFVIPNTVRREELPQSEPADQVTAAE